jgi:hypothetical protein
MRSFDYFVEGKTLARYRYFNAFLRGNAKCELESRGGA